MKKILTEAINSEPIFKYTFMVLKFLIKVIFKVVIFFAYFFFFLFFGWLLEGSAGGGSSRKKSQGEKDAEWLTNCALEQQWERNH